MDRYSAISPRHQLISWADFSWRFIQQSRQNRHRLFREAILRGKTKGPLALLGQFLVTVFIIVCIAGTALPQFNNAHGLDSSSVPLFLLARLRGLQRCGRHVEAVVLSTVY